LTLEFTDEAKQWMLDQNEHPEWGARPLRRIIQRNVREALADHLLTDPPEAGTKVKIHVASGYTALTFEMVTG
ncbi:MAG: hypothetical protein K8S97_01120, partial [Anaerolineae bacterium]|nr:hypothetical protein [Anaerolineae bacterium]